MSYSFPNFEPASCSMSSSNCRILACIQVSRRQVRESGIHISLRIFHSLLWSIPSKGEGNGTPVQYSCLENPMDGGAWWATVHGSLRVGHDWATSLSLFTFIFHELEKEMATHSTVLAWRIPGTGEPGGLPSMGSHRVGHDWSDLAAATPSKTLGSH